MNDPRILSTSAQPKVASYYKLSGKIGCLGPLLIVLVGIPSILLLSFIYGYAIYYIPLIYFNFFIVLGYGGVVGLIVGWLAKVGKVRNVGVVMLCGLLAGLLAEYTGWISWLTALSGELWMLSAVFFPTDVFSLIRALDQTGVWSIFGITPSGWFLYLIWFVEAVMVIGAAVVFSSAAMMTDLYCEKCKRWVTHEETLTMLDPIADPGAVQRDLANGEYGRLLDLKKHEGDRFTKLKLRQCPSCQQLNVLSVSAIFSYRNDKGETKTRAATVAENLLISAATYNALFAAER